MKKCRANGDVREFEGPCRKSWDDKTSFYESIIRLSAMVQDKSSKLSFVTQFTISSHESADVE